MSTTPPHVPRYAPDRPYFEAHENIYVGRGERRATSFESITVPILIVILGAAGLVSATYFATHELSQINSSLGPISRDVREVRDRFDREIERVKEDLERETADRWTRKDHEVWCSKAERINRTWRCPDMRDDRTEAFSPATIGGWSVKE